MSKSRVLFLCTGNSCRSQMAEGLVKHYLSKEWKAYSAGTEPSSTVHPLAIRAMAEIGINITKQRPKSIEDYRKKKFDLVITVCARAAENCPVWLDKERSVHIGFADPVEATGSDEEKMRVFRGVRDDIRRRVFYYLANRRVLAQGPLSEDLVI